MLQIIDYSQKLTPYLFQKNVVLYFESYWKRENAADIKFWTFNKLNDWASQWKMNNILWLTTWKFMTSKREQEIAADNGMWPTPNPFKRKR